jgi:hypothetical protein
MNNRTSAVANLLQCHNCIGRGGLSSILEIIEREFGLPVPAHRFRFAFVPTATRWDRPARTVHLYEISSGAAFPDGTFEAIRDFAERLHDGCGCFTAMWVADGDGHDPLKVWDVRDELIWVR